MTHKGWFSWVFSSVPSPGGGSPVISMVTPARSLLKNTPASLYRQAGKNYLTSAYSGCLCGTKALFHFLFHSDSQGSRCFCHFGPRKSNSSIHKHPQTCTQHCCEIEIIPICFLCLRVFERKTKFCCAFRIWMTLTGQTACTRLPSLQ